MMVPVCFISGILIIAMLGITTLPSMIAFAVLYGFASGGFFSLLPSTCVAFSKGPSEIGVRLGLTLFLSSVGPLTGNPIAGALLQGQSYVWWKAIVFSAVTVLTGTAFIAIARFMLARKKGVQKV